MNRRALRRRAVARARAAHPELVRTPVKIGLPPGAAVLTNDELRTGVDTLLHDVLAVAVNAVLSVAVNAHEVAPDRTEEVLVALAQVPAKAWSVLYFRARAGDTRPLAMLSDEATTVVLRDVTRAAGALIGVRLTDPKENA